MTNLVQLNDLVYSVAQTGSVPIAHFLRKWENKKNK